MGGLSGLWAQYPAKGDASRFSSLGESLRHGYCGPAIRALVRREKGSVLGQRRD
jgi:hypothetical protein